MLLVGCEGTLPDDPSYALDVEPLLQEHCVRCHEDDGRLDGGVGLSSYASARSTRIRSACTSLDPRRIEAAGDVLRSEGDPAGTAPCSRWEAASMPPGALLPWSGSEQDLFLRWIETGARP